VIRATATTLQKTVLKILAIVNSKMDHIPPITTSETNPFPYTIVLNPRVEAPMMEGWNKGVGIY
jgi:autophagy-related protein 101